MYLMSVVTRAPPTPLLADEEAGVLHRPSCLAALAALRHTKWFQVCEIVCSSATSPQLSAVLC